MSRGLLPTVALLPILCFTGGAHGAAKAPLMLTSGDAVLTSQAMPPGRYGIRVHLGTAVYTQDAPLAIDVVDAQGRNQWTTGGYQTVTPAAQALTCAGTLKTPNGTQFHIADTYRSLPKAGAFMLTRDVTIETPISADTAFNSRFSLAPVPPTAMGDCDYFAPGVWYKDNAHVPPTALAGHLTDRYFYFREDRLPLPLMMLRDKRTGVTFTLAHLGGNPTTIAGDDGLSRITDARLQYGAIGITKIDGPALTFLFPGTEGERTYTYGPSLQDDRWTLRSHPVQSGVTHRYRLLLQISHTPDFPSAVRQSWQTVYALQNPPVIKADLAQVYRDGIDLLASYCHEYNGVISMPFAATVPDGRVDDTSSQMGFVGQALPAAWLLLQDGLQTGNADAIAHASELVGFLAHNSLSPAGVPRTWYDIHPDGAYTWRNYHTFLRVACDGADGALQSWNAMYRRGQDKPDWLAFCRRCGDWLARAQNADGSYAREYDFDGTAVNPTTDTTDQTIHFLIDLYKATGDTRYKQAALRAGGFCRRSVHEAYAYVGGTPDNPNVMDKEGGMMALDAFLSLYDATGDKGWLAAATQAAEYSETWVYSWNIPMPADDPHLVFPKTRTTYGLSLIATGHSGADTYMAAAPFLFYRLYLLTGEAHFREVARMLLHDTKQLLDWDNTLGYKYPGLQTEALSLPPLRGHGVTHWLPWLTVTQLEPLVRLRDVFGSMDIDEIEKLPKAERLRREAQFAETHGFSFSTEALIQVK